MTEHGRLEHDSTITKPIIRKKWRIKGLYQQPGRSWHCFWKIIYSNYKFSRSHNQIYATRIRSSLIEEDIKNKSNISCREFKFLQIKKEIMKEGSQQTEQIM